MTVTFTTCGHEDRVVIADILQGDGDFPPLPVAVMWCRRCGAFKRVTNPMTLDRREDPEWTEPEGLDGQGIRFY